MAACAGGAEQENIRRRFIEERYRLMPCIYAGRECRGSLYTDDGKSFAFQRGVYLRMNFSCSVASDGIQVTISKHEGSYIPWWKNLRLEIYGWTPARGLVRQDGRAAAIPMGPGPIFISFTIPDDGAGASLRVE